MENKANSRTVQTPETLKMGVFFRKNPNLNWSRFSVLQADEASSRDSLLATTTDLLSGTLMCRFTEGLVLRLYRERLASPVTEAYAGLEFGEGYKGSAHQGRSAMAVLRFSGRGHVPVGVI